jgi:hypothetical protein
MPATAPVAIDHSPAPPRGRRGLPTWLLSLVGLLGGMLTVAVFVIRLMSGQPEAPTAAGPGEIFLEPAAATGPDPFTPSIATASAPPASQSAPPSTIASADPSTARASATASAAIAVRTIPGGTVGLYGGTKNNTACDMEQLITFLEQNPDKAVAWAVVHEIEPSAIRDFVSGLTPVELRRDTRVTNHGFRDGVADARQSVLQAGTAVLVDDRGVPRARCFCGNPLLEPIPAPVAPAYIGEPWPEFAPEKVEVIAPAPAPLAQIPIVDSQTGEVFGRQPGPETIDTALAGSPAPSASEPPASSEAPTAPPQATTLPGPGPGEPVRREPLFPSDLTAIGAISSNSVDPNFPAALAVDLDTTTSWFSKGPHTTSTVTEYTWSVDGPVEIAAVMIGSNEENSTEFFRTGFGFGRVEIEILTGGSVVKHVPQSLHGSPDPNILVTFPPGTFGDSVRLRFMGHESLDCGGVSEVLVLGPGWEAEIDRAIEEGLGGLFGE